MEGVNTPKPFLQLGNHPTRPVSLDEQQALGHVALTAGSGISPISNMSSWSREAITQGQGLVFLSTTIDGNRLLGQDLLGCAQHCGREKDVSTFYLTEAGQMSDVERALVAGDISLAITQNKIVLLAAPQWERVENPVKEGQAVMDILFRVQEKIPRQETPLLTILDEYQRLQFYPWAHDKFSKKATELGMACIFFLRKGLQANRDVCESVLENSGTNILGSSDNSYFNALGALWISRGPKSPELGHMDTATLDKYLNKQGYGEGVLMREGQPSTAIQVFETIPPTDLRASFEEAERHLRGAQHERAGLPSRAQSHELNESTVDSSKHPRTTRRI